MRRLLIANRGEIACRIMRTAKRLGLVTIAVYSDADAGALHVQLADEAVRLGPAEALQSYLSVERVMAAAQATHADALHPGYGFLSENPALARACEAAGVVFVGPPASAIGAMGGKREAKAHVARLGVPSLPWVTAKDDKTLIEEAMRLGFPLMIKASAGGGGRGLRRVDDVATLAELLPRARGEALRAFADETIILERALEGARHVEIQVIADQHGNVLHLGERDCSLQRRHQKVIEEAPTIDTELRAAMGSAAIAAARSIGYVGAGTIEFLLAPDRQFYFLEMNTRLQVEHPVTEMVTGLDLVELQLRVARGEPLPFTQDDVHFSGHAIEARLYAEDGDFVPQTGTIIRWLPPPEVRVDHGLRDGYVVSSDYDAMLAKVIAHGPTRAVALQRLSAALDALVLHGFVTNRDFLRRLLGEPAVRDGATTTGTVAAMLAQHVPARPSTRLGAVVAALLAGRPAVGFRVHGTARDLVRFELGQSEPVTAAVAGDDVELAGQRHTVVIADSRAIVDGVELPLVVSRERERLHVSLGVETVIARALPLTEPKRAKLAAARRVVAPMNGRVVSVAVKEGDRVAANALLVVLEAMKMQLEVRAPQASTVCAVKARAGTQVAPRAVLVELEPTE